MDGSSEAEIPLHPIFHTEEIADAERRALQGLAGSHASIEAVVQGDLLSTGQYGRSTLLLTHKEILVVEQGEVQARVALDDIAAIYAREFVGNCLLDVRTKDGQQFSLMRYTKTLADAFHEIIEHINRRLNLTHEQVMAQEEEASKISGPREERLTYRCPNCGHPLLSASDACPKCASKKVAALRLLRSLRPQWRLTAAGMGLSIVFTAATLGSGVLVKQLFDRSLHPVGEPDVTMETRLFRLYVIVGVFLAFVVVRAITQHYRIRLVGMLGERVVRDMRRRLYRALQRLSLSYYDREHTGRIMARVLNDTSLVQRFVVQGVQQGLIHLLTVLGVALVLFIVDWRLATIALLPTPIMLLYAKFFSTRLRRIFRAVRRKFATLSATVSDAVSGVRVVKSFAQEDREMRGFDFRNRECYQSRLAAVHTRAKFTPVVAFLTSVGAAVVWLVGGRHVLFSETAAGFGPFLTFGDLMLFINFMGRFYMPVQQLLNLTESFQESATALERIYNIMDMPVEVADHDQAYEPAEIRGRIVLENVSFNYPDSERVLKNVSLTVEPGEMLGLVGQTGSGKSTLVSLVCRFYDPTGGRILLDGHDLRDLKVQTLRSRIGMVLQETFLFAGTIKENIAYGKPEATEEQIIRAAKAANAHDFIVNLPDGYDSEAGERGALLSGGEKQRISIARAILKDPPILILDEATSAVDTATEISIQEAMDRLIQGRTTIAIAHRLSTLRNADKLAVIENGEVVEYGTHEELISQDGIYANLCKIQASFAGDITVDDAASVVHGAGAGERQTR